MSIRIFNGAKVADVGSLTKLMEFIAEIRKDLRDAVHEHRANEIKKMAGLLYDMYHSRDNDLINPEHDRSRIPLLVAMDRLVERTVDGSEHEEYSLAFAAHKGNTYAIPFFHDQNLLKVFFDHPKVSSFNYFNNADKPQDVTEAQWEKRKEVWEAIVGTSGIPAETMLTIRLIDSKLLIPDDMFMQEPHSVEEREEQLARIIAFQEAEDQLEADSNPVKIEGRLGDLTKKVTEIYPDVYEGIKGTLEPITMEDLSKELPPPQKGEEESGEERVSEVSSTD